MKKFLFVMVLISFFVFEQNLSAQAMHSPTWGFFIDLPEGYYYIDGDARDRFSFSGPAGLMFDLVVYHGHYDTILDLVEDVNRRLQNRGYVDFFEYNGRQAAVMKLDFGDNDGWGLAVELDSRDGIRPMLLALSYNPVSAGDWSLFHLSALDSIAPSAAERRFPGPITEYSYPRGEPQHVALALPGVSALIHQNDAEAAQVLIEREFAILRAYLNTTYLQAAFTRYYRFIYRDSFTRIENAAQAIVREFGGHMAFTDEQKRAFAQRTLTFIQGFYYERDFTGSDFVNLVTAVTEGRGDCDSRAMLFAVILANANIRSAMMLSPYYAHAMGLADIAGAGARFESHGTRWLVAETTAYVDIGLIAQDESDPQHWFAILFE